MKGEYFVCYVSYVRMVAYVYITQSLGKPRKVDCGEAKVSLSYGIRLSQKSYEDSVWSGDF